MAEGDCVKIGLPGINAFSKASIVPEAKSKPNRIDTERSFIEHVMKRTLFSVFQRLAAMSTRNPQGLIEDLKALRPEANVHELIDYCNMWTSYVSDEMKKEGIYEQDIIIMHKVCEK